MKKLLCTASLFLAFSMSSFANTNETKDVSALEAKTEVTNNENSIVLADDRIDCYTVKVQVRWIEVDGPEDDPNSYTLHYQNYSFTICIETED